MLLIGSARTQVGIPSAGTKILVPGYRIDTATRGSAHAVQFAHNLKRMQSPDPHCLLHLDAVNQTSGRWVLSLPVFHSLAQLGASPWAEYIASLYAPLDDNDFPIDLRCFTCWWRTRLPAPLL